MLRIRRNNLITKMHENSKSATEIANEIGVSYRTIYNIITKKNTPSVALAMSLANLFGVSIEHIFEFEEE